MPSSPQLTVVSADSEAIPEEPSTARGGVKDPTRLRAVADAELSGHLGDRGLDAVVATLRAACQVPMAVVNIVTVDTQTYAAEAGVGAPCTFVPDGLSFCAEVVETGRALTVTDAGAHPVYVDNPLVRDGHIRSYAGVPLIDDGVILGTVSLFDPTPRAFTPSELEILTHQAELASSVLALRRSARTDVLTGLPNRGLYLDRLRLALARLGRDNGQTAAMYIDVDHFKTLNDTLGHHVGDLVLVELASRLTSSLRATDTVARFGGDEFVACIGLGAPGAIEPVVRRLLATIAAPWVIEDHSLSVSVSIGVALTGSPETAPSDLLRQADTALYAAKQQAGPSWRLASDLSALTSVASAEPETARRAR